MSHDPNDPVSPYDRAVRSDVQLELLLADSQQHRELAQLFGEAGYARLSELARRAARTPPRSDTMVYLLPGILGSQLGFIRARPPHDLLWLDPSDIIAGRLRELRLPSPGDELATARAATPMGAIALTYLPLKLALRAAGFQTRLYDYDWRLSLRDSGRQLALELNREPASHVHVVAHSMGGLLARVALHFEPARVRRVVTLGAPHLGALAPAQALRGAYPTVRRLAALDRRHSAEQLAGEVFNSFPSLYEMLPQRGPLCELDLARVENWPTRGPAPSGALLHSLRDDPLPLAPVDARYDCIAGYGQRTVTHLHRDGEQFIYRVTSLGDGTVPLASAAAGAHCWYAPCEHSELTRDGTVGEAVAVLLEGKRCALRAAPPALNDQAVEVGDDELAGTYVEKIDWPSLGNDARRQYLDQLNLAPPQYRPRSG